MSSLRSYRIKPSEALLQLLLYYCFSIFHFRQVFEMLSAVFFVYQINEYVDKYMQSIINL